MTHPLPQPEPSRAFVRRHPLPSVIVALLAVASCLVPLWTGAHAQSARHVRRGVAELMPLLDPLPLEFPIDTADALAPQGLAQDDPYAALDACVQAEMARKQVLGVSVAVARDGQLIYEHGYGVKHIDQSGAIGPRTRFRIGSVTKMMTAAAVMQQVEAGKVDLDAPVTRYIPELTLADAGDAERITVKHLLTHASSFPDNALLTLDDISGPTTPDALSHWAANQSAVHLHAPPGSFWNYSNSNFVLAGLVAERASGVPYHDYMPQRVWARAGMTETTLLPADVLASGDYSYGHWVNALTGEQQIEAPDSYDNWAAAPAGYAFSTASDLVRWASLLMAGGGDVLSPASAAAMQAPQQFMNYLPDEYYGFGIFVEEYKGLDTRQHGGNVPGWSTSVRWVPDAKFAVAALDNAYPATMTGSTLCAIDAFLTPPAPPPAMCEVHPETWGLYTGEYSGWTANNTVLQMAVAQTTEGFRITFTNVILPDGTAYTSPLMRECPSAAQFGPDTFLIDTDGNGVVDNEITFIQDPHDPGVMWLRNRGFVGRRPALVVPTPMPTSTSTASPPPPTIYLPVAMKLHTEP